MVTTKKKVVTVGNLHWPLARGGLPETYSDQCQIKLTSHWDSGHCKKKCGHTTCGVDVVVNELYHQIIAACLPGKSSVYKQILDALETVVCLWLDQETKSLRFDVVIEAGFSLTRFRWWPYFMDVPVDMSVQS